MSGESFVREVPDVHDASAGVPAWEPGMRAALPTITTPGYAYFTDYKGRKWLGCVCVVEFLQLAQRVAIKRGLLKQGFDIWQLTGGAAASAGTHTQGGAFDLLLQTSIAWATFFRDLGATATWPRYTSQGFSANHLHGVLNGCPHNAPARYQVTEQKSGPPTGGGDGLTGTKPDYVRDPNPYRTWSSGVLAMKKELGILALTTTTTLKLDAQPMSRGSYAMTSAVTSQPGSSYAAGSHVYEFLPPGSSTWKSFKTVAVVNGKSSFLWNYGSSQPIRVRFVPKDANASKASTSAQVVPKVMDVVALQSQLDQLTATNQALTKTNGDLTVKVKQLEDQIAAGPGPVNPPEPVSPFGFDVSGWQTADRVRALVAEPNNSFAIVKATQGLAGVSSAWPAHRDLCGDKYLGAYHYTGTPGNDPIAEADHFLKNVGEARVLALDVETAVTIDFVLAWLDHVQVQRPNSLVGVYTNWLWLPGLRTSATIEQWERLVKYPCWIAEVKPAGKYSPISPKPGSTKGWPVFMHQYAYTPDYTGAQIDRDWVADLNLIR